MINVVILRNNLNQIISIEVKGHADSAPYGQDLVCAAVSAVVIGCNNALKNDSNYQTIQKDGYYKIDTNSNVTEHDSIVLETMITGLKAIKDEKSKFIDITTIVKD